MANANIKALRATGETIDDFSIDINALWAKNQLFSYSVTQLLSYSV